MILPKSFVKKKKLYFLHIPKTAGTSVSSVLSQIAENKGLKMVGPILIDHLNQRPNWEKSDLLAGHLGLLPLSYNFQYFVILRDPLERLYSHYSHLKRDPAHPQHKILAETDLNFEEYLLDERLHNLNYNMQARYLSTVPKLDNSDEQTIYIFPQKAYEFENSAKSMVSLELAFHTLENALYVGDQSNLSETWKFLEVYFGFSGIQAPFLNTNLENQKRFSAREVKAAQPLIELDTIIYQRWQNTNRFHKKYIP
jgi:hypothetical protein